MTPAEHLDAAVQQLVERGLLVGGIEQKITLHVTATNTVRRLESLPSSLPAKITFGRQAMHRPAA